MSEHETKNDFEWLLAKLALEEERGSIVPGGAVGGVVARARRAAGLAPSAAERARNNMRFLACALSAEDENKEEKAA